MGPPTPYNAVLQVLLKDVDRHDEDIERLQADVIEIKVTTAALAVKVGIYAAIGATVGGAVMGAIVTLILN